MAPEVTDTEATLVSVIIPAYNAGRFLTATLDSVVNQSHRNLEIIVIDDGSTDNTRNIVASFQARDPRIIFLQQDNQGVSVARNAGIAISKAEFLAFLDADDLWHPTKIEKQIRLFLQSPADVGLIYTFCHFIDTEGFIQGRTGARVHKRGNVFFDLLLYNFIGNGSVAMVRKSCLPQPYPFDPDQNGNDDTLFYLLIANTYKVDAVPEFLVGYRWDTGTNKSSNMQRQISSYETMMEKLKNKNAHIPTRLLEWSRASFYLSHAQTLFKKKQRKDAWRLFARNVLTTPSYMFSPPFRKTVYLTVMWLLRPLTSIQQPPRLYLDPTQARNARHD